VFAPRYRIEHLNRHHDRDAFSCGKPPLDEYLKKHARRHAELGVCVAFVLLDTANEAIAGYYTLSSLSIRLEDLPPTVARRLPPLPIPAVLLGRLAVDTRYQGQKLGAAVLVDALKRAQGHAREVGAVGVVVDAKDEEAKRFYVKFGFEEITPDPSRLFITMKTIAQIP